MFIYSDSSSASYTYKQNWRNKPCSILDLVQTEVIYSNSCLHLKLFVQFMTLYNSTAYFNNNYRKSVTFGYILVDSNPQYLVTWLTCLGYKGAFFCALVIENKTFKVFPCIQTCSIRCMSDVRSAQSPTPPKDVGGKKIIFFSANSLAPLLQYFSDLEPVTVSLITPIRRHFYAFFTYF